MSKQLQLPVNDLVDIGFKEKIIPANKMNLEMITYEIPVINGCFYYNKDEETYRWYHKTIISESSNHIHLNITSKQQLYLLLSCFKVKFNHEYFS